MLDVLCLGDVCVHRGHTKRYPMVFASFADEVVIVHEKMGVGCE
jgi:hypothetical protein